MPGIILLITGAFIAVAADTDAGWSIVGGLFVGVGASLVLDEFALILHLQDVYWSNEGRISVEMVSLAIGALGLVLVGVGPFSLTDAGGGALSVTVVAVVATLLCIVVCVDKGKFKLALFGAFIPPIALAGAIRLARPDSRWSKRRYHPHKQQRAAARTARDDARFGPATDWILDFVAGRPSQPDPTPTAAPSTSATSPPG